MQKDSLIPKHHRKRNKPHQNSTSQFDAVYLNVFLAKKQLLPYSAGFIFLLGFGVHPCWEAAASLRRLRHVGKAEGSKVMGWKAKRDESRKNNTCGFNN